MAVRRESSDSKASTTTSGGIVDKVLIVLGVGCVVPTGGPCAPFFVAMDSDDDGAAFQSRNADAEISVVGVKCVYCARRP
jgi:hypothetical protein